jgi:hypothetical protein
MFCEFAWMVVPQPSNSNTLMAVLMPAPEVTGPRAPPKGVHFHAAWQGCSGRVSYAQIGPKRQFSYTVQQISIPQAIVIAQLSTYF